MNRNESGVSSLLEYLFISGIMILFIVITVPMVTSIFIEQPTNQLTTTAFIDVGNGISTRIVDLYSLVPGPNTAHIKTVFDIPDDIAGRDYIVEIEQGSKVVVSRGDYQTQVSLGGISVSTMGSTGGRTSASGWNIIRFDNPP
ncbi:MAG TPA: hypothetical protein PK069_07480 [Methanolinea sp.]|nr:hypothetical protein [Methanolinea sp.]HQK56169.1 hypothetical protein [Methanolinea sp.]